MNNQREDDSEKEPEKDSHSTSDLVNTVKAKATRKLRARRNVTLGVWFGLGMVGLIGWSVVIPTLMGAALGMWLDKHQIGQHSWTLALLMAGLTLGCFNAWHWVSKEDRAMREEDKDDDLSE